MYLHPWNCNIVYAIRLKAPKISPKIFYEDPPYYPSTPLPLNLGGMGLVILENCKTGMIFSRGLQLFPNYIFLTT